jgi:DNA-directed RNA polymerase specialized sigma24 family protein
MDYSSDRKNVVFTLTIEEAVEALGFSATTAKRHWTYARAFLRREMERR